MEGSLAASFAAVGGGARRDARSHTRSPKRNRSSVTDLCWSQKSPLITEKTISLKDQERSSPKRL